MSISPRAGFTVAWAGECRPEAGRRTDREFAPVLDILDAIESAPASTRLSDYGEWAPVTPNLLQQVRDGLTSL